FLARHQILSFEEITRLVRVFVQLGVRKVRITGGEPLLRHRLETLIGMLSGITKLEDIALTTNGYFLEKKAALLKQSGLDRLTISLDTLNPETFEKVAGKHLKLRYVLAGIEAAQEHGFATLKINAVVKKGINEKDILALADFGRRNALVVRFIEYMDVGTLNGWRMADVIAAREIISMISAKWPIEPMQKNYVGEVANRYRYLDGGGEVGIIASVTQPFCTDCTRARLSADGKFFTCLFANSGFNVLQLLRSGVSDKQLLDKVTSIWRGRTDRYSEERFTFTKLPVKKRVEMYQIGG
ncbi:MAG: GTP 3',8-cyclase MoaA, partial [bacterium]